MYPQVSVLGPLLFLIYINDLEENIHSQVRFFADDTMLFSIVKNPIISANELNQDLETIRQWAHQWKLEFNPDPTKQATEHLFSCKNKPPAHPPLFFNGNIVTKVDEHKHLGLILDKKLSFKSHLNEKILQTKKTIGMIKHLSRYLPVKTLLLMYKSLVRPHFDYCDIIFHIPSLGNERFVNYLPNNEHLNILMAKIESAQYQAALAITGTWQGTSRIKLYKELGLESLSARRSLNRIIQLFKIKNNHTPEFLRNKLPSLSIQDNPNANPNIFNAKVTRTQRYRASFFPNVISLWNNTIGNIAGTITKNSIKSYVLKIIRPIPTNTYGIHDPIGLHYLFQLRTGLSPLRSHKFRHRFLDTPTDICNCNQGIENTSHFIFECFQFAIHRVSLAVEITNILQQYNILNFANNIDFYLYGHPNLSINDNRQVLLSTIKYIKNSQRFPLLT